MIKEKQIIGFKPIAFTDYVNIYISKDATASEKTVLRKHTKAHIYLKHRARLKAYEREFGKVEKEAWCIAEDIEIALHIYNKKDEEVALLPRSNISGGIYKHNLPVELPKELKYCEEIYEFLAKKKKDKKEVAVKKNNSFDASYNADSDLDVDIDLDADTDTDLELDEIIKKAIEEIEKEEEEEKNKIKIKKNEEEAFETLNRRKQTLSSLLERKVKENYARKRKNTYLRQSRRCEGAYEGAIIKKGVRIKRKIPKVLVFVDRSGSFCNKKTDEATKNLDGVLKKFRLAIKKEVYFFNSEILEEDPLVGSGGTNYKAVRNFIANSGAEIAVVITDDDMCDNLEKVSTEVIVIPTGCNETSFAKKILAEEVRLSI